MLAKNTQLIKPWSFLLFMACAILILPACGGVNASEAEVAAKAGQVNEVSAEAPVPTATPLPPPPTETPVPPTDTSAAANSVVENEAPASTTVEEPAASTETTVETSAVDVQTAEAGANFMCAGSANFGLTCLDETGWHTFTQSDSPLGSDLVYGLTTCADGRMLVTQGQGVSAFDGSNWENYGETDFTSPDAVACDAAGHIWVAHYQGVSMFDGSWTTYPASELATGEAASDLVNDVVIDSDGLVWVVTSNSIASFDGEVCLRTRTG